MESWGQGQDVQGCRGVPFQDRERSGQLEPLEGGWGAELPSIENEFLACVLKC